ncbi:hypothetical protein D3C86_2061340 [compost metagenome]
MAQGAPAELLAGVRSYAAIIVDELRHARSGHGAQALGQLDHISGVTGVEGVGRAVEAEDETL